MIGGFRFAIALSVGAACLMGRAQGQGLDFSHGGPVDVTAAGGLEYNQKADTVTAQGNARAVRGDVTVLADTLTARLRKKAGSATQSVPRNPAAPTGGGAGESEIYRLEADGNVRIFTPTDHVEGASHGVYDIDQAVLVLTGPHMVLTTPQQVMTARDAMEYWSQKHMAVGRGNAVVTTSDGRRISADTLVGYTTPNPSPGAPARPASVPPGKPAPVPASKLERVDAFGHVVVRTPTETVTGDRGVYIPATGIARLVGNVHVTRGQNQLNGADAVVNLKTGISTLRQRPGGRVQGLVVPNDRDGADNDPKKKDGVP